MTPAARPPVGGFSHEAVLPAYRVIRSRRRTMAIEVTPAGEVLVRVPWHTGNAQAHRFVTTYRHRIWQRLEHLRQHPPAPPPDAQQAQRLRQRAQQVLPPLVDKWAQALGVTPAGVRITAARTRFGSCSSKGRLCFSYLLMRYPMEAIEYVVLHEVAHLRHLDHGAAFYRLLSDHMPDHKRRRALLRQPTAQEETP